MQSRWMLKVSFYFGLKGRRDLIPFVYRICSSDNKSWRCLVLPLKTAPKKLFWLMAVVEHVTCVCLDVCTGSWIWSFATASCLSGRFHFLLSLLLPRGLPVSVRAEKRFLVLFLRQSGLHSGQNLGVKNIFARAVVHLKINQRQWKSKKKKINQSSRTAALWPKPAKVTALDAAHDAFLKCYFGFSQQTQTVTENDFFFVCLFICFAVPLWRFQTALWSGACWRTRRLDEPSWWVAVCTCSSRFRESTPSCEWKQTLWLPLRFMSVEFRVKGSYICTLVTHRLWFVSVFEERLSVESSQERRRFSRLCHRSNREFPEELKLPVTIKKKKLKTHFYLLHPEGKSIPRHVADLRVPPKHKTYGLPSNLVTFFHPQKGRIVCGRARIVRPSFLLHSVYVSPSEIVSSVSHSLWDELYCKFCKQSADVCCCLATLGGVSRKISVPLCVSARMWDLMRDMWH